MADWTVAIEAFKVMLRATRIAPFRGIGMGSQDGPVSRNIVSHKLTEDGPASRGGTQGLRRISNVSAIADTPGTTKRVQELLIGLKRREIGKLPRVTCGA